MADVDKCVDCGKRGATVYKKDSWGRDDLRSSPRCPLCASHNDLAVLFKKREYPYKYKADCRRRDAMLTSRARRARKTAKHCPNCHGYRPSDAFIKGSGPFGRCQLCRDLADSKSPNLRCGSADEIRTELREASQAMRDARGDSIESRIKRERARVQATISKFGSKLEVNDSEEQS